MQCTCKLEVKSMKHNRKMDTHLMQHAYSVHAAKKRAPEDCRQWLANIAFHKFALALQFLTDGMQASPRFGFAINQQLDFAHFGYFPPP
jgi:hypothetical protein